MSASTYGRASSMTPMAASDGGRIVLDSNLGITNVSSSDTLRKYILDTFSEVTELLRAHCGPKSKYAMVVTGVGNSDFEPNIFTKDGIKILSFIEYTAPIQAYLKEAIAYIGKRVDNVAKDGTTTTMIFAAQFLSNVLKISDELKDQLTTTERENMFKSITKDILAELDTLALTVNDISGSKEEAAGKVGFMQTMSSSGGNYALAKLVQEIFTNSPQEAWDRMLMTQSVMESDTPFEVRYQESDYVLFSNMVNDQLRNVDLGTRYVEHNVRMFAYPDDMAMGTTVVDRVCDLMDNWPSEKPLAILAQAIDAKIVTYVNKLNATRERPISLFCNLERDKYTKTSWDILAILAMSGTANYSDKTESINPIDPRRHIFKMDKLEMNGSNLELFGFSARTEGSNLHPFYTDPERFLPYTELLASINHVIKFSRDGHAKDGRMTESAYRIFKQMVCVRSPNLWIGGTTHENISNLAVVQDAMGASMASTTTKFIAGGLLTFNTALLRVLEMYDIDEPTAKIKYQIAKCMHTALHTVIDCVYTRNDTITELFNDIGRSDYINALCFDENRSRTIEEFVDTYLDAETELTEMDLDNVTIDYPVLQPIAIYSELLDRTSELLARLMATDKIIAPGGAFLRPGEAQ